MQREGERGQELVEYALILPILLLLLTGIMEVGIAVFDYNTIANAAREGARAGIIPTSTNADVENAALALTSGLNPSAVNVTVNRPEPCSRPDTVEVRVTYDVTLISGLLIQAVGGDPTFQLAAQATMQCE